MFLVQETSRVRIFSSEFLNFDEVNSCNKHRSKTINHPIIVPSWSETVRAFR